MLPVRNLFPRRVRTRHAGNPKLWTPVRLKTCLQPLTISSAASARDGLWPGSKSRTMEGGRGDASTTAGGVSIRPGHWLESQLFTEPSWGQAQMIVILRSRDVGTGAGPPYLGTRGAKKLVLPGFKVCSTTSWNK